MAGSDNDNGLQSNAGKSKKPFNTTTSTGSPQTTAASLAQSNITLADLVNS